MTATDILLGILSVLFWPLLVTAIAIGASRRWRARVAADARAWMFAFAKETLAQLFFLFGVGFLGLALLGFNRDFALPFSGREVLFVTALVALLTAYAFRVVGMLVFAIVGLGAWWTLEADRWIAVSGAKAACVFAGLGLLTLLLVVLGSLHARLHRESFALAFTLLGLVGAIGFTFLLSTKHGLMELERGTRGGPPWASLPLGVSLLVLAGGLLVALAAAAQSRALGAAEALAILLHGALFAALALMPEQRMSVPSQGWTPGGPALTPTGVAWAIGFNGLVFFQLVGMMLAGHARRAEWLVNLGAVLLFVVAVAKYFDWFFAFLDKSVFFIGAGLILLAVGWLLERGRRRMITSLKEGAR